MSAKCFQNISKTVELIMIQKWILNPQTITYSEDVVVSVNHVKQPYKLRVIIKRHIEFGPWQQRVVVEGTYSSARLLGLMPVTFLVCAWVSSSVKWGLIIILTT